MTTTLEELITSMTVDEAKTAIYDALAARGVTTTGWKPGAVVRTIIAALAIILAAFSELQAAIAKGGFLDLAEGAWLTLLARYTYGVERDPGSFAAGPVLVTNSTGNIYSGDPGDLVFLNSATSKTYRNTEAFTIGALATNVSIAVEAIELGIASTSLAGDINQLVTPLLGVAVANPSALVGADEETDALLRERCRLSLGALSPNGPRDAYAYFARSARNSDGSSIGVTRSVVIPDGYGNVDVYVATASGVVTGDPDDPDTALGAINAAIQQWVVPDGVTANIASATALTVAVTYEVWVRDTIGMTEVQIKAAIDANLSTSISGTPIGGETISPATGKLYAAQLTSAIDAALPLGSIVNRTMSLPAADVSVGTSEAPVAGTITGTVHFVSRGGA